MAKFDNSYKTKRKLRIYIRLGMKTTDKVSMQYRKFDGTLEIVSKVELLNLMFLTIFNFSVNYKKKMELNLARTQQ